MELDYRAGIRETTYDHSLFRGACWCDGTNCPPRWRTYERVPARDEFSIDGKPVTREAFEAAGRRLEAEQELREMRRTLG